MQTTPLEKHLQFYETFVGSLGLASPSLKFTPRPIESLVPHTALRNTLLADPSVNSIASCVDYYIAPSHFNDAPFRIDPSGLILLSATLMEDRHALACAARLGMEARFLGQWVPVACEPVRGLWSMAQALVARLPPASRALVLDTIPGEFHAALTADEDAPPPILEWLGAMMGWQVRANAAPIENAQPLCGPVEQLLVSGGDSRLRIDDSTGLNRYGVPPRPRPEAVHFSSSTASAISDHGFMLCDMLRRDLLVAAYRRRVPVQVLRAILTRGIGDAILAALGLEKDEADVAVLPSGTDSEHVALLVAIARPQSKALVNLLVGPDESGRGVLAAARGDRFDPMTHSGETVAVGEPIQHACMVDVQSIQIRDAEGMPRSLEAVDSDIHAGAEKALSAGSGVLAHVLMSSKTGLTAPSETAVDRLLAASAGRVDVVADACQARLPLEQLGRLVRKGWMVQVSGSKFLTGPPFSGALVVPSAYRQRAAAVGALLEAAPGISHESDWTGPWSGTMAPQTAQSAGFGPPFRWLPALLEAWLFAMLPEDLKHRLFQRFRNALLELIEHSSFISPFSIEPAHSTNTGDHFLGLSILSFQVLARHADATQRAMTEEECQRLFVYLNNDMSGAIPSLRPGQEGLARLQVHVGQPVTIQRAAGPVCVLRLVLGARFFNFVGHAGPAAMEAALQSEIGDARRAIQKIELLASEWANISKPATRA